jgi:ribosomal protein S1
MSDRSEPPQLNNEIDAALEGVNLQDMEPETGAGRKADGPRLHSGTVVAVTGDDVFVELGPLMQGVAKIAEFAEPPAEGAVFEFALRGKEDDLWLLSRKEAQVLASWREMAPGQLVKATVTGQNTGGLELKVGPISAFMPASHVDLKRIEDFSPLFGETLLCEVLEVNPEKKRVLLSRRSVLESEREQARSETMDTLTAGQVVRGKVARVESFGAFVEIAPGVEGLMHVSNISRKRVENPADVLEVGATVEVMILDIKEGGKRIGLGMKQLERNPWDDAEQRYREQTVVTGKVTRLMEFGAFVEIEDGLEGLLHVSQLLHGQRVNRPGDVVSVDEEVTVRVLSVDGVSERISLSRLDERGAVLGSEEALDAGDLDQVIEDSRQRPSGLNLGSLLRKALDK